MGCLFFTEVHVISEENVPRKGPLIATATHHNMMLDPAILSSAFPYQRILHYWSKASLFANPVVRGILISTGNIPVDRKSKDRQALFRGTFDTLSQGAAVALFPEGTSYTESRIMQVKDGAAWSALEYAKWAKENPDKVTEDPLVIVPTAIVYTNKSKYRSYVIMEFGRGITLDPYIDQFLSAEEGAPRAAIGKFPSFMGLTYLIAASPIQGHISTQLTNSVLSALPLPDTLDPYRPVPLPSLRLPLFIFPLMIHLPAYVMARLGARLVEDEEETQAQNKILFGLLLLVLIYPAAFFFLWAFLWYTPVGALFAGFVVWLTAIYHTKLVNDNYEHAKRLVAAWRVLIGVWAPKRFEYPLTTLAQYTTTPIPPVNPWISGSHSGTSTPKPGEKAGTSATSAAAEPPVKSRRKRRPRSGRVMRHVLRARAEAVRALASFVDQLEKGPAEKCVNASAHLARAYGGGVEDPSALESQSVESAVIPPRNYAG
ncbi:hypothetical protein HETIRDRAFT_458415 [Heterobasidion irregulare TC 32-1]|uniref:Phospholipid/glycerol acyltransferase domain-containing protein n=1 Tax=Heterobasidion irregulare (strain TC 32-1) TaxID=747525 RepID=W4KAV2_HETIT|nr:uncharacterized protein HETIRDRAFT_458415 [Heterobasidion irregulare TC 32-1]ETW82495.1 hypothetical protein HETIRDRAFT_458415 [Heterobasidion irregulare TC 32-1]